MSKRRSLHRSTKHTTRKSKISPKRTARKHKSSTTRKHKSSHKSPTYKKLHGGNCGCGFPMESTAELRSGLRLPKPNFGEAAAIGLGTLALTGNPRAGLGLGLGSYYAGRLFNNQ